METGSAARQEIPRIFGTRKFSPYPQAPGTCPYPEPAPSSPTTPSHFLKIRLNIILPSTSGSPQWSLSLLLTSNIIFLTLWTTFRPITADVQLVFFLHSFLFCPSLYGTLSLFSTNHYCVEWKENGKEGSKNWLLQKKSRAMLMFNRKAMTQRIFRDISAGAELPICLRILLSYLLNV